LTKGPKRRKKNNQKNKDQIKKIIYHRLRLKNKIESKSKLHIRAKNKNKKSKE
jgi:hypothetical protein